MAFENVKMILEQMIPFVKKTGVKVESLEKGRVKLVMPHDKTNYNPLGILHAGSLFTLAETTAAALCLTSFDQGKVSFIGKEVSIRFRKPAKGDVVCEAVISEEDAAKITEESGANGKADGVLVCEIKNKDGDVTAEAKSVFAFRKVGK